MMSSFVWILLRFPPEVPTNDGFHKCLNCLALIENCFVVGIILEVMMVNANKKLFLEYL